MTDPRLDALVAIARHCWRGAHWQRKPGSHPSHVKEPLKFTHLERHLTPAGPYIGLAPIVPGTSETRIALLDMDSHKGEVEFGRMGAMARLIAVELKHLGLTPMAFRSSGGQGIHLLMLWDEPQDAHSVRHLLTEALAASGHKPGVKGVQAGEVEIFPKQDSVPADGCGSMFILPFAGKSEVLW